MGGVDDFSSTDGSSIANSLGYDHSSGVVDAPGAGNGGRCEIETSGSTVQVDCASSNAAQDVRVTFNPSNDDPVSTSFNGDYSVSS
jgi:hypothetical protein